LADFHYKAADFHQRERRRYERMVVEDLAPEDRVGVLAI